MASTAAAKASDYMTGDIPTPGGGGASATSRMTGTPFGKGNELTRESYLGVAQRIAARINAANIDPKEIAALETEHRRLVQKKFGIGFTKADQRRLNFVRWSLDRIQDARHGYALDKLEQAVEMHEQMGRNIKHLITELHNASRKGQRR